MDIKKEWQLNEIQKSEEQDSHRPLEVENSFYFAVCTGDMDAVRENLNAGDFTNPEGMGRLSTNELTNLKYHFVDMAAGQANYSNPVSIDKATDYDRGYTRIYLQYDEEQSQDYFLDSYVMDNVTFYPVVKARSNEKVNSSFF